MWQFQYKHGDRPLEGYTIQRAAGRGGFGEVYYAVSDSGREVALKAVTGYEQIELRGISQCMNLKNPHLVTVFDVKHNDMGRPFVLMEFVAGPSLRQLLDESPGGLGTQKSAFFLREISKGLTYLHECGIVHRDLKPGNIFYENGYVKIGDYGLSKAIAPTQHSGQTITVGTVHYMAPEIGGGRYDKSIDIYAMGAVLYEMLTGQPPFLGASAGEILLKHVASEPDVSNIEEPFKTVIRKAMAKDPADRYQSVQEMVEAVFGAAHVQQSVSCFSPDSLSMVAQRVAQRVAVGGGSATPPPVPGARGAVGVLPPPIPAGFGDRLGNMFDNVGDRVGALGDRMAHLGAQALCPKLRERPAPGPGALRETQGDPAFEAGNPLCDPMSRRQRRVLSLIILGVVSAAAAMLAPVSYRGDGPMLSFWIVIAATVGTTFGRLLAGRHILPNMNSDSPFLRKVASGGTAAGLLFLFGLPVFAAANGPDQDRLGTTLLTAAIAMMLLVKPPDLSPSRRERVGFGPAMEAAFYGFLVWIFCRGSLGLVIAILGGSHLLAQVLSAWDPFAAKRRAHFEGDEDDEDEENEDARPAGVGAAAGAGAPPASRPGWADAWDGSPAHGGDAPTMAWPPGQGAGTAAAGSIAPALRNTLAPGMRPVPLFMRWLWLAGIVAAIPTGVALLVGAANTNAGREEEATMLALGAGSLVLAVLCIVKSFQGTFRTWWRYAGRWGLMWACVQTIFFAAFMLGIGDARDEAQVACIFFIVMPAVLLPILLFVRLTPPAQAQPAGGPLPAAPTPQGADAAGAGAVGAGVATMLGVPPAAYQPGLARHEAQPRQPLSASRRRKRSRRRPGRAGEPLVARFFGFVRDMTVGATVTVLLLLAIAAGSWVAFDVPGMLAAGLPHPELPAEFTHKMGTDRWPQVLRAAGYGIGWASLLMAAVVMIVTRRRTYGLHMLRGVAGVGVFALSLLLLGQSTRNAVWLRAGDMAATFEDQRIEVHSGADGHPDVQVVRRADEGKRLGAAVEHYFNGVDGTRVTVANLVALLALMFICWPARKAGRRGAGDNRQVTAQQDSGTVRADAAPDPAALRPNQA